MEDPSAMLARLVREAIGQFAAPEVADRIERSALQRSGLSELPEDPLGVVRFVDDELVETLTDYLGEDAADAVRDELAPILESAKTSSGVLDAARMRARSAAEGAPEDSSTQPASRVLVADDDAHVLDETSSALELEGYEVVTATDGHAALELCQSMAPDVVVADLHLRGVSGRRLIATLERTMEIEAPPVIIITANVFAPSNIAGAAEVLRKPLDIDELTTAIELAAWDHAAGI
jgi:CheY-like chemotaxis protein